MLISVIIPAFNREKLISDALESVVNQCWRPIEAIIVDDGSTDQTAEIAEKFAERNAQANFSIRVIRKENAGSTAARNSGIAPAKGDALLFLDSDDVLSADGLTQLATSLADAPEADFSYGRVRLADEQLVETGESVGTIDDNLLDDPVTYHWHTMAALYRKELVAKSGGWDERSNGSDDWVFQARIKLVARKAIFVDANIGIWRQHIGERLGATTFREDYTVDVTKSCLAIFRLWQDAGRMRPSIQKRLYFRTLRHCWELGRFGSKTEKMEALKRLKVIGEGSKKLRILTRCAYLQPSFCDPIFFYLAKFEK